MNGLIGIRWFFVTLLAGVFAQSNSQNLVSNASFEYTNSQKIIDTSYTQGVLCWDAPNRISGLLLDTAIADSSKVLQVVPYRSLFQAPVSGKGRLLLFQAYERYQRFDLDTNLPGIRSYARAKLADSLSAGTTYTLRLIYSCGFRKKRNCLSQQESFLRNLGICFDTANINYTAGQPILRTPDLVFNNQLDGTDFSVWDTLEMTFVASGGESYMLIGNFDDRNSFQRGHNLADLGSCADDGTNVMYTIVIDDVALWPSSDTLPQQAYSSNIVDSLICDTTAFQHVLRVRGDYESITWSDASQADSFLVNGPGTYFYDLQFACGTLRDSFTFFTETHENPIPFDDTLLCFDSEIHFNTRVDWKPNFLWSTGDTGTFLLLDSSTVIILEEQQVCRTYSDSAFVRLISIPLPPTPIDTSLCVAMGNSFSPFVSLPSIWKQIIALDTIDLTGNPVISLDSIASYSYLYAIRDSICISLDAPYLIEIDDKPFFELHDSSLCIEDMTVFGPSDNWSFLWSDGWTSSPRMFDSSGHYMLQAENFCGIHQDTMNFQFLRCSLQDIENSFSPNDDGLNDVFYPIIENYTLRDMKIFNRWGERIYEQGTAGQGWDGRFKGVPVELGWYLYFLVYEDLNGQEIKLHGGLMLVR